MKKIPRAKFDFEKMKAAATSEKRATRKEAFVGYFEEFGEFPSYLFDNEAGIDRRLSETIRDLLTDADISKEMRKGLELLLTRLPS